MGLFGPFKYCIRDIKLTRCVFLSRLPRINNCRCKKFLFYRILKNSKAIALTTLSVCLLFLWLMAALSLVSSLSFVCIILTQVTLWTLLSYYYYYLLLTIITYYLLYRTTLFQLLSSYFICYVKHCEISLALEWNTTVTIILVSETDLIGLEYRFVKIHRIEAHCI